MPETPLTEEQRALCVKYLGLASWCVRRQRVGRLSHDEAVSVALEALCKVARSYDPTRSTFPHYAIPYIRGQLTRARIRSAHVGRWYSTGYWIELRKLLGDFISLGDVRLGGAALGVAQEPWSEEGAKILAVVMPSLGDVEGDEPVDSAHADYPCTVFNVLPSADASPEEIVELREQLILVRQAVECLPSRDRQIVALRFGEEETLVRIGERLSLSSERVRQLEVLLLRRLRQELRV